MIIFSGHIANWEIGLLAAVQYGISVAQIYRAANNPLVDRMIARFRGDAGELIPKGAVAARRAIAVLRRGAHLTMLADQKMNDGIPVPFFGRPAMTAPALASLALRFRLRRAAGPGRAAARRAFPADRFPASALAAQRRPSRRCRRPDGAGQRDPGGLDPRPPRAMVLATSAWPDWWAAGSCAKWALGPAIPLFLLFCGRLSADCFAFVRGNPGFPWFGSRQNSDRVRCFRCVCSSGCKNCIDAASAKPLGLSRYLQTRP